MKRFMSNSYLKEFFRFLIIGGISTIIDYLVCGSFEYAFYHKEVKSFISIYSFKEISNLILVSATTLGAVSGLIFNYIFGIIFVYDNKGRSKSIYGFVVFTLLTIIGLLFNNLGMYLGYSVLGFNQLIMKVIMTIVILFYNYFSKRFLLFKE